MKPDLALERAALAQGARFVAGVDEVGRGPLAGPVGVAAVILGPEPPPGLDDSKKLGKARREALYPLILESALSVSVVFAPAEEIDRFNIRGATLRAMARAVAGLALKPDFALIDGRDAPPGLICPARAVVGGDGLSASIAAASIVAKVARDRLMARMDGLFPGYGFAAHAGYPTAAHRAALTRRGQTPLHRRSFRVLPPAIS
jgi:ribonuclease HII